jgi:hypothetical protein
LITKARQFRRRIIRAYIASDGEQGGLLVHAAIPAGMSVRLRETIPQRLKPFSIVQHLRHE